MKKIMVSALLILSANAFAGTDGSSNSGGSQSNDCIESIRKVLNLNDGSRIQLNNGQCGLEVSFEKSNSGVTKQDYRTIEITPSQIVDVQIDMDKIKAGIPKYAMMSLNQATLQDNSNGLNSYHVKACDVGNDHIAISVDRKENFGWYKSDSYQIAIQIENGKIKSTQARGDGMGKFNCQF